MSKHFPLTIALLFGITLASLPSGAYAAPKAGGKPKAGGAQVDKNFVEIVPGMREKIRKGLAYLKKQQQADGSFSRSSYGRNVGITSLAALAFMSDGNLPRRGKYGTVVDKALKFILKNTDPTGLIAADVSYGPMYGHGFATLFLAEIYGMTNDKRVYDALKKAVDLIERCQNDEGGWRYQPVKREADVSVTICQVMALRAARNAGIKVSKATINKAVEYVRRCQNGDGGFRYMLQSSGSSAFPRSAAGVATLFYAGIYKDDAVKRGLDYMMTHLPGSGRSTPHYHYGHYYAVQAAYLAPDKKYWQKWFPAIRKELLSRQNADGSWAGSNGITYATSMSLIVLQIPNRYLPIFQK